MGWLSNNWIWILLIGGFVAMHLFGHGHSHGGHGRPQAGDADGGAANDPYSSHAAIAAEDGQSHRSDERHRRHRGC